MGSYLLSSFSGRAKIMSLCYCKLNSISAGSIGEIAGYTLIPTLHIKLKGILGLFKCAFSFFSSSFCLTFLPIEQSSIQVPRG